MAEGGEPRARRFDCAAVGCALVAAEIVHNHDVAGLPFGNEKLFDIGLERDAVDRPIEDHGPCR